MKPLVGFDEARRLDAWTSETYGLSADSLMESAAKGMADSILADDGMRAALRGASVPAFALCGRGGNGGDALAVLRRLAFAGFEGCAAAVANDISGVTARRLDEARKAGVLVLDPGDERARESATSAGLVLDGISGIGFSGTRRGSFESLAALVAKRSGPVVAIDVPSGIWTPDSFVEPPPDPVRADATLCVLPLKRELFYPSNRRFAGRIIEIGGVFHASAGAASTSGLLEASDLPSLLPQLDPDCHKGDRGSVAVYAGAEGSAGAAVICAKAASAGGAGSVTVLAGRGLVPVLSSMLVSQMVRAADDPGTRRFDVVVVGPGWGVDATNAAALHTLWESDRPLVADADALRLLAANPKARRRAPTVLTPHPGEFAPLLASTRPELGESGDGIREARIRASCDAARCAVELAERYGAVVALKGAVTWIASPEGRVAAWDGREATLATAGSGDALAGLVGGYLARGASAWDAAAAAVLTHGLAGRHVGSAGFFEAEALLGPASALSAGKALDGNQG